MEIALERVYHFDVLMLLAGTVNGETPTSTKLRILSEIMEWYRVDRIYPEVFKKNLDDLSVQEVHESTSSSDFIQLSIDSIPQMVLQVGASYISNFNGTSQVGKKREKISWHVSDQLKTTQITVTWVQFTAEMGKTEYLQLLLDHG